ncbi:MAG: aminotransferase class I/II-fold pyridoxal phosphate-dependent enzyme [Bacteroidota bacterium]
MKIPLSRPNLSPSAWEKVKACLDTAWISSAGPAVGEFESQMAQRLGSPYAVAVQSGTAALHLALRALNIQPGDQVALPNLGFIASANAVRYVGATPVLIDVDPVYWQLDTNLLKDYLKTPAGRKVKAVMVVHLLGYMGHLPALADLLRQYDIPLIEDAAEAVGSTYQGKALGTFGDIGVLSFNGNKILTTGGGGMALTRDESLAQRIRHLSQQAKSDPHAYWHDDLGYNYRMTNLAAALGLAQLEALPQALADHRSLYGLYQPFFDAKEMPGIFPDSLPNHWLVSGLVSQPDTLREQLAAVGIQTRRIFPAIHLQKCFREAPYIQQGNLSTYLSNHALSFPTFSGMTQEEQAYLKEKLSALL